MTKHTQGPWTIGKQDHDVIMIDTANGTAICDVYGDSVDQPANARLIAAAPDLLEALETLYRAVCIADADLRYGEELARAAIAKAKAE